jgi:hypothetical protein
MLSKQEFILEPKITGEDQWPNKVKEAVVHKINEAIEEN